MNRPDERQEPPGGLPGDQRAEGSFGMPPPPYGCDPAHSNGFPPPYARRKKKWLAGLFSFMVPGTGHMYLGLMTKGITIMLLLVLNICGIVFFGVESGTGGSSVLIIVLLSLLIPILYFYTLFDALQQADAINERYAAGWPPAMGWNGYPPAPGGQSQQVPVIGIVLLAVGGVALFSTADTSWTRWLLHSSGSMLGAVILIVVGAIVWLWGQRGQSDKRD
ncbi:hypothetical protein [Cohnella thermotolerans]|uniref:hypothetical protein n=1 Tax=Cohnella thermotolerans TaxID=329858 RepID=UPI00041A6CD5|nr:hypothetical protein [Cohnella thermotolerans]